MRAYYSLLWQLFHKNNTVFHKIGIDQMTRWKMTILTTWPDDQMNRWSYWPDDQITTLTRWPFRPNDQLTILTRWPADHFDQLIRWPYWPDLQITRWPYWADTIASKSVTRAPQIGTSTSTPDTMTIYDDLTILIYRNIIKNNSYPLPPKASPEPPKLARHLPYQIQWQYMMI